MQISKTMKKGKWDEIKILFIFIHFLLFFISYIYELNKQNDVCIDIYEFQTF